MPSEVYSEFSSMVDEVLSQVGPKVELLLIGDFNIPNVDWKSVDLYPHTASSRIIHQLACYHNLNQFNNVLNNRGVLLDLVFSSVDLYVHEDLLPLVPVDAHHPALDVIVSAVIHARFPTSEAAFDFRRCNLRSVADDLQVTNLLPLNYSSNTNDMFNRFCYTLQSVTCRHTPVKRPSISIFPKWFSSELKQLVILKKILHKEYKQTLCRIKYIQFSRIREACRSLSSQCHSHYIQHMQDAIHVSPKVFWNYVRSQKAHNQLPSCFHLDGTSSSDPSKISELFADFFSSVFSPPSATSPSGIESRADTLSILSFTEDEVIGLLAKLDVSKGPGPDLLPPNVLKHCRHTIASPLTLLINKSIAEGVFPDIMKVGFVVPIYKSGQKSDVRNYCPIVIQPVLAKVFEKLVLSRIWPFFKNVISPHQHGFTPNKSTSSNLVTFQSKVISAFTERRQMDVIYLDFAKAFDRVSHYHLLAKLESLGIVGSLIKWFHSYLHQRKLVVKFEGHFSSEFLATSGVPQGSHLGPLLFNIFVNDITHALSVDFLLFADDIKLFNCIRTAVDCLTLQTNLNLVTNWCKSNLMDLNIDKCQSVTFHRMYHPLLFNYSLEGHELTRSTTVRDLGVTFTSDLSPAQHIENVCSKAYKNLGFIYRTSKEMANPLTLKILYCAYVRSILEYCSVVWSPHQAYLQNELQGIQDRFIRLVGVRTGFEYRAVPKEVIATQLSILPLYIRRNIQDVLFLFKLLNNLIDAPDLLCQIFFRCSLRTRSRELFGRRHLCTNYEANSTMERIQRLGNLVAPSVDFFSSTLSGFRAQLMDSQYL